MVAIEVVSGDITAEDTDAIVNAANASLLGGGGVDGAIHRAAGPRLAEAGAAIAPCLPGDAKATPAFDLDPPVRHIIHTVGPIWAGGGRGEADVLASCYRAAWRSPTGLGPQRRLPGHRHRRLRVPAAAGRADRGGHHPVLADRGRAGPAGRLRRGDARPAGGRAQRGLTILTGLRPHPRC